MSDNLSNTENLNWVDPDIIAEMGEDATFDQENEREFMEFFESGWLDPKFDDIREKWDTHIHSPNSHGRMMAKVALWSVVRLRELRELVNKQA